jgi:hypothetical protein
MHRMIPNINGDAKTTLMLQLGDARRAINDAHVALSAARPNGRNYQTCDDPHGALTADTCDVSAALNQLAELSADVLRAQIRLVDS